MTDTLISRAVTDQTAVEPQTQLVTGTRYFISKFTGPSLIPTDCLHSNAPNMPVAIPLKGRNIVDVGLADSVSENRSE